MADTTMKEPLNSQGVKIYVLDVPATPWADCTTAVTAIQSGKQVLCPQSLGALEQTRSVKEYRCLSSNDSIKVLGAISRGSIDIGLLYAPDDVKGQKQIADAFQNNTPFVVGIEINDIPAGNGTGGNGTVKWFIGKVSSESVAIEMDSAILYNATIEVSSDITTCPAVAPKP